MKLRLLFVFLIAVNILSAQLTYGTPESVGLNSIYIESNVDSIMNDAITQKAFPGAQLLVVKKGNIIFHKGQS